MSMIVKEVIVIENIKAFILIDMAGYLHVVLKH